MKLAGSVVLVTGGSSGIGRHLALALARQGACPLVAGRDVDAVRDVAARTDGVPLVADLAAADGASRLADAALAVADRIDALILCAGVGWRGPVAAMTGEQVERLLRVDLLAPIELTAALLPGMLERGRGHVVAVSSIAGMLGVAEEAVYAAAKAGLVRFADSLRLEVAARGVDVTVVVPGVVRTAFFDRRGSAYHRSRPRPLPPERVADATVRALRSGAAEVVVPRWLRVPIRAHGMFPRLYRSLAQRFD